RLIRRRMLAQLWQALAIPSVRWLDLPRVWSSQSRPSGLHQLCPFREKQISPQRAQRTQRRSEERCPGIFLGLIFLLYDLLCVRCVLCREDVFYLIANGFTGEATAPVTGRAGATNMNS